MSKYSPSQLRRLGDEALHRREKDAWGATQFADNESEAIITADWLNNVLAEKKRRKNLIK